MTSRRLMVGLLTVLGALAASGNAWAVTTVSRSGNVITITGGAEANYVDQPSSGDSGPLLYSDPAGINYGPGCADNHTGNTVVCGNLGPGLVTNVSLGAGDDTFRPEATITTSPRLVVDLGPGNDTTWGSAHDDVLNGGDGNDRINGRGGNDTIDGGAGQDQLSGAGGDDTVIGGPGRDSLFGDGEFTAFNYGNDTLRAHDGEVDALSCSFGADVAEADPTDVFDVLGDCEQVDRSGAGGGLAVTIGAPSGTKLGALLRGKSLRFRSTFSAPCRAAVGLVVRRREARRLGIGRKDTIIGRAGGDVPEAGTYATTMKIATKYRAKLRRARSVTSYIVLVCTDAGGVDATAARKAVLRR